jgi:kinesin family protein 11
MDTQLHSLDDIVSRIRAQNDVHHEAHTASLSALSSTVQSSYTSIGDHLSSSFSRVQSLETDMSAQVSALKDTLPALSEGATIREPLHELRDEIANQKLVEYQPTGETPQRVAYNIPSDLPRTENHETLLARLRNRSGSHSSDTTRSPTKTIIFNDATNSTTLGSEDLVSPTFAKPNFPRSASALPSLGGGSGMPVSSLRELDVNVVSQESSLTALPLSSPTDIVGAAVAVAPSLKSQAKSKGDGGDSKLPMKKMARKTVAGIATNDRENLSITSFSSSVGPGGRRLRSHGST